MLGNWHGSGLQGNEIVLELPGICIKISDGSGNEAKLETVKHYILCWLDSISAHSSRERRTRE